MQRLRQIMLKYKKLGVCAETYLSTSAIMIVSLFRTSNVITLMLFLLLLKFYNYVGNERKSKINTRVSYILSSLFAIFMTLKGFDFFDYHDMYAIQKLIIIVVTFIGFWFLFLNSLHFIFNKVMGISIEYRKDNQAFRRISVLVFLGILFCWLPFYLLQFPGIVISDSCNQIAQAMQGIYSNHHPVIQTWMMKGIFIIGMQLFGNLNACIALYCLIQMIILAAIYAYCISYVYSRGISKKIVLFLSAFYALMPYNIMFSINMWKDTLFSAFVLLFVVALWKAMSTEKLSSSIERMKDVFLIAVSGIGVCLFRNNGFYAFLVTTPFIVLCLWKRRKDVVIVVLTVIIATFVIKGPVFNYFQVTQVNMVESLSIPIQQLARVISDDLELSDEQNQLIEKIVDKEEVAKAYDPEISDPIKILISEGNEQYLMENKSEYLKLWMQVGMKYPFQYLRAYINQTQGYWNPDIQRWAYTEGICETKLDIYSIPLIKGRLADILRWYVGDGYVRIPLYGMVWSIGTMVWLTFILAGLCLIKNKRKELLLFIPVLVLWGTLMIATPVFAEFRYLYAIFLCIPIYLIIALEKKRDEN